MKNKNVQIYPKMLKEFQEYLEERENSPATVSKYLRDVRTFFRFAGEGEVITKELLLRYKEQLMESYAVSSVNSMLVALNQFLVFLELGRFRLKQVRVQRQNFLGMEKELTAAELDLLVRSARKQEKKQLVMIMETLCATGIRVSELKFFRLENVRNGVVKVWNKGKYRLVILPELLQKKLLYYAGKAGIRSGMIFCTGSGREKDRSNIWRELKALAGQAGVAPEKVFPHNFRHLFARTFYQRTKNLVNLADILGHSSLETTRIYTSQGIREWKKNLEAAQIIQAFV